MKPTIAIVLVFILFSAHSLVFGQTSTENIITYKAPSSDFIDIVIQSHNGLPRFGELYFHNGVTPALNNSAYKALVEMKFLAPVFKDMDLNKLTKTANAGQQAESAVVKNSQMAQQRLFLLAKETCAESVLLEHFCDTETSTPCEFTNRNGQRMAIGWGGSRKNEFKQMRSYKTFVKDYYPTLTKWSNTFFPNDEEKVHYVFRSAITGKYDFKAKGYWISPMAHSSGFMGGGFLPYTENEKILKNRYQLVLFPISPEKAKDLKLQDRSPIFTVFKVVVKPQITNVNNVQFDFELDEQLITIYKDIALTEKIGEIDISSMQLKQ